MWFLQKKMKISDGYMSTINKIAEVADGKFVTSGNLEQIIGKESCLELEELIQTPEYKRLTEPA